jgi:hypothetical protein
LLVLTQNFDTTDRFDSLFKNALKREVENGFLLQPHGPSGNYKLAKPGQEIKSVSGLVYDVLRGEF